MKLLVMGVCLSAAMWAADGDFAKNSALAIKGNKQAQYNMGIIYETADGVKRDYIKAAQWYKLSAVQGYQDAQFNLGIMYKDGIGVERNLEKARMWLGKAAAQGDTEAAEVLEKLRPKPNPMTSTAVQVAAAAPVEEALVNIVATTLRATDDSVICSKYAKPDTCLKLVRGSVFTSTSKKGNWYKISGTVKVKEGWKAYNQEGWLDASRMNIR